MKGRPNIVLYLVTHGANIHAISYDNKTALQLALERSKTKCAQILSEWTGNTRRFLSMARTGDTDGIREFISDLERLVKTNAESADDATGSSATGIVGGGGTTAGLAAILSSASLPPTQALKFFVDQNGKNGLMFAAQRGHLETAKLLLQVSELKHGFTYHYFIEV